jgi:hypothetical protein
MYSLVLFDTFASWDNDRDHTHVFYISHTMVVLKITDLAYLLIYTVKIMDTHSYDDLLSCRMYTINPKVEVHLSHPSAQDRCQ